MCEIFNCQPETPSFMPIWLVSLMILGNLKPKAVLLDIFSIKKWNSTKDLFKDMQLRGREVKNTSQNPLPLVQVACGQPLCPHLLPWCELSISIVKLLLKVAWVMTLRTTTRASQYSRVSYSRVSFPYAFSKTTTSTEYFLQCLFAKIQFFRILSLRELHSTNKSLKRDFTHKRTSGKIDDIDDIVLVYTGSLAFGNTYAAWVY